MKLRQTIFLVIALTMVAALVACSSSGSKPPATVSIAATSGSGQSQTVGMAFANTLSATVTTGGTPTSGVSVTFTAPASGASGTFADGGTPAATDTEMTNASGVATSTVFTANNTAGAYNITATVTGATTPASFSMTNTSSTPNSMTAASGSGQSATISTAFAAPLVANVVDAFSNPVSGVSVTFTAPASGSSGTFASNSTNTETDTTDASGNATSSVFTANATVGGPYNVVATSGTLTAVNFALTNNAGSSGGLAAGNYVFSLNGTDSGSANCTGFASPCTQLYAAAGVLTVDASGNVTGGEMSFSDFNYYALDAITGGSVAVNPVDTNLLITINTGDSNIGPGGATGAGTGTLVLDAAMSSATRGLITEYDSFASAIGQLDLQTSTAALCPTTPCGYAFRLEGSDATGTPVLGVGGIFTIDGAGGAIDGVGSVFDINDVGGLGTALTMSASTVSAPDSMGLVTIILNSSAFLGNPGIQLDGYIIDAGHIRMVENWVADGANGLGGATGGTALAQTGTGTFSAASISGATYVVSLRGADANGPLQAAGELTFNSNGTISGNVSFNDIVGQSPQGGTTITGGTWADDGSGAGRVNVTGVTDGVTFNYNLELYETGSGFAAVLSLDAGTDTLVGRAYSQASGLGVASLTGNYTLGLDQWSGGVEFDGVGQVSANSAALTLTGFTDENGSLLGLGLGPDQALNSTYTGSASSPIISINGNGGGLLTLYLIDGTQGVVIENDSGQLTLGYATNQ